ncbi:MAG TPA: adenylate/guanylate cyclase domain-containing protein [Candidatus Binatia bacterium]|nr:adenylate/guanylate cyclase domain-containing protein [Candidatus Binatia bacterium]
MRCPHCQHENQEGARFCQECGTSLTPDCTSCGARLPAGAKFCIECGTRVAGVVAPIPPRSMTPAHLVDKILRNKNALEGERKQITILFADVQESMSLSETVDPETWTRILDGFFAILSDGIHRFEGTINNFTGDGVMALFGAPIAHEDHAQRACFAALYLIDELAKYAEIVRRDEGLNFSVRMGMNSGEVIVGRIGDDLHMDYTAQGHTVGLASRMESLAAADKCYMTEHTATLVADYFSLRDLGPHRIKGVSGMLRVFELQGIGANRTRLDVSRSRGLSRFVGREIEMNLLEEALEKTRAGSPQIVGVMAEGGAGKSRLCFEFIERCKGRGLRVICGHCVAHGTMIPFYPVLELLRDYFGIEERDSGQAAREKVAGRLLLIDDKLRPSLPLVFEFLGIPDPEWPAPPMDPEPRRRILYGALRRVLDCGTSDRPALIVLEDLHWIDGASQSFLEGMIEVLPSTSCMMLLNYRPEFRAPWSENPIFAQVALEPLGAEAISALLVDLLGEDGDLAPLRASIEHTTAGNPFFVEELVHALVEAGSLEGTRGRFRLVRPIEDIILPPTVHSVLAARIDHLPEAQKELLQTAAVVGKQFGEQVLSRVSTMSPTDLHVALQALCDAGFLYEREVYPQALYAFAHPLTQEVAYRTQLGERRRIMHGAIARVLDDLDTDGTGENAALLAHHWEAAGEMLEAALAYRRAADWASGSELAESRRHWTKVMELLERLAPGADTNELAVAATEGMLSICWRLGSPQEQAHGFYDWGWTWAERSGLASAKARLLGAYGIWHSFIGEIEQSLALYDQAADLLDETCDVALRITLLSRRAYSSLLAGKLKTGLRLAREVLDKLGDDGPGDEVPAGDYLFMMGFTGLALTYLGRLEEAGRILDRTLALGLEAGEVATANSLRGFGVTHAWFTGDAVRASALARGQLDFAERIGSPALRTGAYDSLGIAHLLHAQWDPAVTALETALTIARESGTFLQAEALMLSNMAEAYRGRGDFDLAVEIATEALAVARRRRTVMHECRSSLFLGRALIARGDTASLSAAAVALSDALAIVERTEARAYEPYVRMELASLAQASGDMSAHRRELARAVQLFREIGAPRRAEQASLEPAASSY